MPNVRSPGQTLLNFAADREFIAEMDRAAASIGESRSEFIRSAIAERLQAKGFPVPAHLFRPPSRLGKGGFRPGSKPRADGATAPPDPVNPSPVASAPAASEARRPTREEIRAESQACIAAVRSAAEQQARALGRPELAQVFANARLREMAEAVRAGRPLPRPEDPPQTIPPPAHPTDKPDRRSKKTPLPS